MAGRPLAGAEGSLFLTCDGTAADAVFGWDVAEAWPDAGLARAAWQQARRLTWRHPHREDCWPPAGAVAWDGITQSANRSGWGLEPDPVAALAAAVEADVASVEAFAARDPRAAAGIEAELAEYVTGLRLLAGLAAVRPLPWGPLGWGEMQARAMARTVPPAGSLSTAG